MPSDTNPGADSSPAVVAAGPGAAAAPGVDVVAAGAELGDRASIMTLPSAFASFDPFVERRPTSLFQVPGFEMLLLKNIHFTFSRLRNAYF
ncbi:hypothetical protein CGMCC3_g4399 [Colletotrichum fructicola]|nr:uncharacterized protein CGMCC3_g4399 [Colletotrichum fructicola]KAE9579822.1 hypothetical protein CGMCC3_g4399 [Colletotrichum fructicola]